MPDDYTPLILVAALFLVILLILYVVYTKKISALTAQIDERARNEYQKWRQRDYESLVAQQTAVAHRESQTQLNQWKIDNEAVIRQDAIARSRAVIVGKVVEHIVPYAPVFPYNPKDARFVGSPVDLIVFDGVIWNFNALLREVSGSLLLASSGFYQLQASHQSAGLRITP